MIESIMLFAVGALSAMLAAIALLPALWRRSVRLTRAELQATLPVTPEEIAAEKDQIRAAAAIGQRRLELKIEEVDAALQAARVDIGAKITLIQTHEATIAARIADIERLTGALAERDDLIARKIDRIAELERERDNLATNLSASRISNQALDQEGINLRQAAEQRQARLDEQDQQIEGLLARIADIQATSGTLRGELQQRTEDLRAASRTLRDNAARISILERKLASAEALAEERGQQIAQFQDDRRQSIEESGALIRERDASRTEAQALASQKESLRRRMEELETLLERSRGQNSELVGDLMRTIDTLRQEKRQADDEISAMRFEKARVEALLAKRTAARRLPEAQAE